MALTLSEVQSPDGDVDGAVWFPALSSGAVDTLLTGFIADAVTKTDDEEAQEQWVYYRAATAVAERLTSSPASNTKSLVDQGSKTTTTIQAQIDYWVAKAAGYLARFETLTADTDDDEISGWRKITSLRHAS